MATEREEFCAEVLQLGASDSRWYYLIHPRHGNKLIAFKSYESQGEAEEAASKVLEVLNAPGVEKTAA